MGKKTFYVKSFSYCCPMTKMKIIFVIDQISVNRAFKALGLSAQALVARIARIDSSWGILPSVAFRDNENKPAFVIRWYKKSLDSSFEEEMEFHDFPEFLYHHHLYD